MTQSIATLGIAVTQKGVAEADRDLGKLTQTGARAEQQIGKTSKAMQGTALSAKQLQAATRNLPAQFTDIATSLGSGQRPLQVLLQQGGQIKDMFGGIGPAIRAMGGYVVGLINPVTLLAAGVGILGAAWYQATDRAEQFNKALIFTGNYAASSADDLAALASKLDETTSATTGRASEALAQVAATGRFTADQLEMVTRAALLMEDATGQAIEETIKQFVALKADPVDAILKLNDTQHFLTQATLDQIASFKEQGREADAAALAMRAYADTIDQRAPQAVENLGLLAGAWRTVKKESAEAWDTIVNGFARADVAAKQGLRGISDYMQALRLPGGASGFAFAAINGGASFSGTSPPTRGASGKPARSSAEQKAFEAAERAFDQARESSLSKAVSLEERIKQMRKDGLAAGKSQLQLAQVEAQMRARYAESLPKGRASGGARSARAMPDFAKDARAELDRLIEKENRATESFLDMKAALEGPLSVEMRNHEKRIADLNAAASESPIALAGLNDALVLEAKRHADATKEIERQLNPLGELIESMRFELDMIGLSNAERAVMNELRRAGIDIMSEEAQAALATGRAFEEEAQAKQRSIDLMDDFRDGASNALADFVTGAKSAKDALKDFFDEMAAQIAKAISDKWMQQLFGQSGTSGQGTAGGNWLGGLIGALFGGGFSYSSGGVTGAQFADVFSSGGAFGFAKGGYTGDGPANEVAGVVHRGEYVIPADQVKRMRQGGGKGGGVVQNISFMVEGRIDRSTQSQVAARAYGAARRAAARNG